MDTITSQTTDAYKQKCAYLADKIITMIGVLLLTFIFSLLFNQNASAASYSAPEDTNTRYALEYSSDTNARTLKVNIFFQTKKDAKVCATDFSREENGVKAALGYGVNSRVTFSFGGTNTTLSSNGCFTIPASKFSYDSSSTYYKATLTATINPYSTLSWANYIHFRLSLSDTSGVISYAGGVTTQIASKTYNSYVWNSSRTDTSNYSLYLATPCNITSNTTKKLYFMDLDSGSKNGNIGNRGNNVIIRVYDETTNTLLKEYNGANYSNMQTNGATFSFNMTFQPQHKYRITLYNISGNNVIRYQFPYDNIAYYASCPWSLTGSSTIKVNSGTATTSTVTATPGDTLNWTHKITNNGPYATNVAVVSNIGMSNLPWSSGQDSKSTAAGVAAGTFRTYSSSSYTSYVVTQDDVSDNADVEANQLCQWTQYDPYNSSGARNGRGNHACAKVPYNYSLTPSITLDKEVVDVGTSVSVIGKIDNSGTTKTKNTQWQFSQIIIPSGKTIPTGGSASSSTTPCSYYTGQQSSATCSQASFSGSVTESTGNTTLADPSTYTFPTRQITVPDLEVGTKICYALSVKAKSSSSTDWINSSLTCIVVSKHPLLQTLGGDVIVGRGSSSETSMIRTSVKDVDSKRYGSWSEYAVLASGSITGIASASGYAGGSSETIACNTAYLTFNNKTSTSSPCTDATLGYYNYTALTTTVADKFTISSTTPAISGDVSVTDLASKTTYTSNSSNSEVRLTTGTDTEMPAGKWVVINAPKATVTIMSDLKYTSASLSKTSDIPQLVIIAKKIVIADSVTQVDAWLIATSSDGTGSVNTCGAGDVTETTTLNSAVCANKLTVNGPVITNHLLLRRTAGAGTGSASGYPAEVFNLRPDAYLWALSLQTSTPKAQTVQTVELPPRY